MARIVMIALVWCGCAVAWAVLGLTLMARSGGFSSSLNEEVEQLWGPPLAQRPPTAQFTVMQHRTESTTVYNVQGQPMQSTVDKQEPTVVEVPLASSDIRANFDLEHRQKGLLWFSTYGIEFQGRYAFENRSGTDQEVRFNFPVQQASSGLDGFSVRKDDGTSVNWEILSAGATWTAKLKQGESAAFVVKFHTRGTQRWTYLVTNGGGQARNFQLTVNTNFPNVDFPTGSVSPSNHNAANGGWQGEWKFESLISSAPVGIEMPQKLNPGPLAARITYFAPVGLLFFFFVTALLAQRREKQLHPAHYFFLGTAFFAFHLLFAYLADHLPLAWVFAIASVVSVSLVVSYVRLFAGWGFAVREVGVAQVIYLVLFSLSFLAEGFTGLAITCGAVVTLFVMMQVTGRHLPLEQASHRFGRPATPREPTLPST